MLLGILCLSMFAGFIACKKSNTKPAPATTDVATVKLSGSSNVAISYAAAAVVKDTIAMEKNINKNTWTKEVKHRKGQRLTLTVKAAVTDGKEGSLEAQIIRSGRVVKSNKLSGKDFKINLSE